MARAPKRNGKRSETAAEDARPVRDRIIDATLALLAERPFGDIGLGEIAEKAGATPAELREAFDGKLGILAGFARRIDLAVLSGPAPDMDTVPRDRLFEAEMRRFDALAPYREAIRGLAASARRDPALACALRRLAGPSQARTHVGPGIDQGGRLGRSGIEGAVLVHAEAMRTWLDDEDPDLARTMATLDRALRRGERAMRFLDDACSSMSRALDCGRRLRDRGRAGRTAGKEA